MQNIIKLKEILSENYERIKSGEKDVQFGKDLASNAWVILKEFKFEINKENYFNNTKNKNMNSKELRVLNKIVHFKHSAIESLNLGHKTDSIVIGLITRKELCKRLNLSTPTIMLWERKGLIPVIRIGESVRYNWPAVIEALENQSK